MQTESEQLFEESKKYIPGGVNSPVRAFGSVGRSPIFIKKAKGSRIFDEDGREYIDYVCSWGPGILGHAKETVIEAVKAACDDGLTFGAPTRKELEIAELITAHMPSMEMSRMVNSGTEAVMSAIRAARGFTGRDYIVKFKGCYHGHSDGLLVKAGSGVITQTVANSAGVPEGYAKYTLVAEYNDEESVKQLFDAYKGQIAAIIVEPVAANMGVVPPKAGFLEFLRDITQTDGALLIFDEVITGFRLAPGGAQEYFHIKPDLSTLGKIVGGGDVALEDALYLANVCEKVYLIHRRDELRGAKVLQQRIFDAANIEFLPHTEVREICGENMVDHIVIEDNRTEEKRDLALSGIFIAVGMQPQTALVKDVVEMENDYIRAGEDCRTNVPFLYAIGDVRTKTVRQIATAIGDGAAVIASLEHDLLA